MILVLLGLLDIIAGITLMFLLYGIGASIGLTLGILITIKGVIFFHSVVSIIDVLAGLFLIIAALGYVVPFTWVFALWLLQKGFFSFFSM
jgi:hypothetical protein